MANVNNYIAAGRSAVRKNLQARKALAENKADYGALGQEAIKAERDKKIAVIQANAKVANAAQDAMTQVKGAEIQVDMDKSIANSKSQARKAGMLAGGAALLGVGAMQMNKKDEPDAMLAKYQELIGKNDGRLSDADQKIEDARAKLDSFKNKLSSTKDGSSDTSTTELPSSNSSSSTTPTNSSLNLNDNDFKELAYAVSSEAALGTDDEFGVAANIITRLKSGKYGSSISEIIRAPGQYEGVYKGYSKYSPEIQSRLQSPEGQAKISEFIKKLDGRTEFKGQSMLHNRVKDEDPMFDPSGNFYHYAGQ